MAETPLKALEPAGEFVDRHIGPRQHEIAEMCAALGKPSLDAVVDAAVPEQIRTARPLDLPPPLSEAQALARLAEYAEDNARYTSLIGMGYYGTVTPPV